MSRTIWKYEAGVGRFVLEMPAGARVLSVGVQFGKPCLWALVDPAAPLVAHGFAVTGTGHQAGGLKPAAFVGTFQLHGGALIYHLFDTGEAAQC